MADVPRGTLAADPLVRALVACLREIAERRHRGEQVPVDHADAARTDPPSAETRKDAPA